MAFRSGRPRAPPTRFPKKSAIHEASAFLDEARLHEAGRKVRRSWLVEAPASSLGKTFRSIFFTGNRDHRISEPSLDERRCQRARQERPPRAANRRDKSRRQGLLDTRGMKGWRPSAKSKARKPVRALSSGRILAEHRI